MRRSRFVRSRAARGCFPGPSPRSTRRRVAALFVNEDTGPSFDAQHLDPRSGYDPADNPGFPCLGVDDPSRGRARHASMAETTTRASSSCVSKNDATPTMSGPLADICNQDPGLVAATGRGHRRAVCHSFTRYNGGGGAALATPRSATGRAHSAVGCTRGRPTPRRTSRSTEDCNARRSAQSSTSASPTGDPDPAWPQCASSARDAHGALGGIATVRWARGADTACRPAGRFWATSELRLELQRRGRATEPSAETPSQQPNSGSIRHGRRALRREHRIRPAPVPQAHCDPYVERRSGSGRELGREERPGTSTEYVVTVGLPKPLSRSATTRIPPSCSAWRARRAARTRRSTATRAVTSRTRSERVQDVLHRELRDADDDRAVARRSGTTSSAPVGARRNLPPPTFGPGPSPYPSDCVMTRDRRQDRPAPRGSPRPLRDAVLRRTTGRTTPPSARCLLRAAIGGRSTATIRAT